MREDGEYRHSDDEVSHINITKAWETFDDGLVKLPRRVQIYP